jgi:hypothetical protein
MLLLFCGCLIIGLLGSTVPSSDQVATASEEPAPITTNAKVPTATLVPPTATLVAPTQTAIPTPNPTSTPSPTATVSNLENGLGATRQEMQALFETLTMTFHSEVADSGEEQVVGNWRGLSSSDLTVTLTGPADNLTAVECLALIPYDATSEELTPRVQCLKYVLDAAPDWEERYNWLSDRFLDNLTKIEAGRNFLSNSHVIDKHRTADMFMSMLGGVVFVTVSIEHTSGNSFLADVSVYPGAELVEDSGSFLEDYIEENARYYPNYNHISGELYILPVGTTYDDILSFYVEEIERLDYDILSPIHEEEQVLDDGTFQRFARWTFSDRSLALSVFSSSIIEDRLDGGSFLMLMAFEN